jgi:histidinol-phosphatase
VKLPPEIDSDRLWSTLAAAAEAAARHTVPRFRAGIAVDNKASAGFDPVTEADRQAERAIRDVIAAAFPGHSITGEELQDTAGSEPFTWIIDPIDGTRGFVSGIPLWGTLIGLTHRGRAVAGLMSQPFVGETFAAVGAETRYVHNGATTALSTSGVTELADARLTATTPEMFASPASRAAYDSVEDYARLVRYGTDCYGYCLLAAGHIDVVVEEGLKPYDIAALVPIIEAAGGVVSTWAGGRPEAGGQIVATATEALHADVLALLAPAAR